MSSALTACFISNAGECTSDGHPQKVGGHYWLVYSTAGKTVRSLEAPFMVSLSGTPPKPLSPFFRGTELKVDEMKLNKERGTARLAWSIAAHAKTTAGTSCNANAAAATPPKNTSKSEGTRNPERETPRRTRGRNCVLQELEQPQRLHWGFPGRTRGAVRCSRKQHEFVFGNSSAMFWHLGGTHHAFPMGFLHAGLRRCLKTA